MHIVLYLYDVLRFDSTVVINVLTRYIMAKVKQPKFEVYYMNMLLS